MKLYRALLKLYPARFREEYAALLARQFADESRDATGRARALLWLRALADLATSIPREFVRELAQDLRFSLRVYRQRAFVTTLALAALALAIGGATGVFSVLNAVLLRGLPVREPQRLVVVGAFSNLLVSRGGFHSLEDWAAQSPYLASATDFTLFPMNLDREGQGIRVNVATTAPAFFEVLGVTPRLGRAFAPEDRARDVAVISNALWQQAFGESPAVLGQAIRLNGVPLTIIGVAPPGVDYPAQTAVWTTVQRLPKLGSIDGGTIGRLRDGVSLATARSLFHAEVNRAYNFDQVRNSVSRASLNPLRDVLAGPIRDASLALLGAVGFVLLIACANVAQLFLARTGERRRELAIRTALGASRARLTQQLITEAVVLTLTSAGAGLLIAYAAAQAATAAQPAQLAAQTYSILDARVLAFAVALALLTGLVFGVVPAISALRPQSGGQAANRWRMAMVGVQAALTVILLAGAVTLGRSFLRLATTDLGFRTANVVTLNASLLGTPYYPDGQGRYYDEALRRIREVPGVLTAGAVDYLPLIPNFYMNAPLTMMEGVDQPPVPLRAMATPDYFRTMGIELLAGRDFAASDRAGTQRVVIVNQEFAHESGLDLRVLGRTVQTRYLGQAVSRIVGVVRTVKLGGPTVQPGPQIYFPFAQQPPGFMTFVARVRGDAAAYLPALRDAVQQVDPAIPVYDVKTLNQRLADNLAQSRFYTLAMGFLAGFALLLAAIGIYGTATYAVEQRTKEIGVRLAVGAPAAAVRGMLARQSLAPMALGLLAGAAAAGWLDGILQTWVAGPAPLTRSRSPPPWPSTTPDFAPWF